MTAILGVSLLLAYVLWMACHLLSFFLRRSQPNGSHSSSLLLVAVKNGKRWAPVSIMLIIGFSVIANPFSNRLENERILRKKGLWDIPERPPSPLNLGESFIYGYRSGGLMASFSAHGAADGGRCDFDLPMLPQDTARSNIPIPRAGEQPNPPCVEPPDKPAQRR